MDNFLDTKYNANTAEFYVDFDWLEFIENLFKTPPKDPFTYRIEFLDCLDPKQVPEHLGNMFVRGAKQKYNKEIADLTPDELSVIHKYFHSIGKDFEYRVRMENKYVPALGKIVQVNGFMIDFKPCSILLDNYNKPEKIINTI